MLLSNEVYHYGIFFLDNYSSSNKQHGVFRKSLKLSTEQNSKHIFESGLCVFLMCKMCVILIYSEINDIVLDWLGE